MGHKRLMIIRAVNHLEFWSVCVFPLSTKGSAVPGLNADDFKLVEHLLVRLGAKEPKVHQLKTTGFLEV